jgi:septal ring factor EnvC (AmiA/AmiB activator)
VNLAKRFNMLITFILRLETSVQASNNGAAAQQESRIKLLDDFKTIVNQLRLNKETELRLNNRIVELVQSNDRLTVEKNAREREIEGLANQIDELKRDLIDCRGQLSSKHDELATALAAPKEDPRLRVQIQDLETANGTVTGQLESSNQELAKVKEELSSIRDSARRKDQQMKDREQELNDAQSRIKTLQEEKTKILANKQQEIENASQEERHRVAKAAETSKATLKMKLESEINHLERKIKEKDTELAQVRERLQTAQDGSDTYENNTNNLQRELVLYKEQFLQQIAQLKRLDGQNPGLEISDRLEDTLQSVRDECTELRSHLESIRTENSQNMEAALSGQQAIEENLRHIDGLENENEKLKERNSELQKRVENLNEAYNQQKALHAESRGNQSSMDGVKSIAFATPQGMLLRNQQIQDTRPSSRHIGNLESGSNLNNDRFHDGHGVETPEDALRKASRSIGSSRSGSQAGKAAQTSSVKFANNFETPPIRRQELLKEGSTNVNSSHPDSSVASQTQRSGSGTRSLKVAARKHGTFGQSSGKGAVPHQLNRTTMFAQGVQATYTGDGSSRSTNAADLQGSSGITPFTAFPSSISTESPITDLSSMMEELGSVPDQEQLQDAYAKARGKKDDTTDAKVAGIKVLQTFALRTMNSLEEVDGGRDAIPKSQARRKSMSNEEEALRRRTLQPPKPAIKKSKADNVSTSEPKPIVVTESSNRSTRAGSKAASQIQDGHRGSYNRAVSGGRSQTPKAGRPHVANKSAQGISNDAEHSPNIPPAKRNGLKRAPPTTQIQGASKRVRTSRGISLTGCDVVPDSQEMQTV